jgi:hypothetical protein
MLDTSPFSDAQWWSMCDASMSLPVPLSKADLQQPFVYERSYGVFYVPFGQHQQAMSILLAFRHGLVKGIDVAERLGLSFSSGTADEWLRSTPGTCFRSSVGKKIQVGSRASLNALERRLVGREVAYVFE